VYISHCNEFSPPGGGKSRGKAALRLCHGDVRRICSTSISLLTSLPHISTPLCNTRQTGLEFAVNGLNITSPYRAVSKAVAPWYKARHRRKLRAIRRSRIAGQPISSVFRRTSRRFCRRPR
jgi:hypothetical protein